MRISDWSSDVCSSDLSNIANASTPGYKARDIDFESALKEATTRQGKSAADVSQAVDDSMGYRVPLQSSLDGNTVELSTEQTLFAENAVKYRTTLRSEEHTSELQSLMRISYAVFCLKKKKTHNTSLTQIFYSS